MKLTRKGYIIIAMLLLVIIATAAGGVYYYSEPVRSWFTRLQGSGSANNREPAPTAPTPAAPTVSDAEIKLTLLQEILKNEEWRKHSLDVEVNSGVVTLRGTVENEFQRLALEQFARGLAGVRNVTLALTVKPAVPVETPVSSEQPAIATSPSAPEDPNERLAKEVEFACYKTDAFDLKRMQFIADNGNVRLRGRVRSRAEKLLAERIVREVAGVKSVTNQLELDPDEN
ncbi:MAG: BON domain-containing protein [Acidobacteriota bacterium]